MMAGEWDDWIGREQRQRDHLDPALSRRWCATFDRDLPSGGIMPQGIHLCLCTPESMTQQLGFDGHPRRDQSPESFLPDIPLPRRMWASSTMSFEAPIAIGAEIERVSKIEGIAEKSGSSGTLVFINIAHETTADGTVAVRERQTLVYRAAAAADAPLAPPPIADATFDPSEWGAHRVLTPDPRLLFRYSALTFNTHRIHYDAPYARDIERYRGLVVHGPLTASLLLQLAAREVGENRLRQFEFRGVSPAIVDEPLHLVIRPSDDGYELGAFAEDGRQITKASAEV